MPAAVLLAALLPLAICGCSASTPEGEVKAFITARAKGEESRAAKLTVEGDLDDFSGGEPFLSGSGVTFDLSPAEVESDRAVVTVHFHWEGGVVDIPYVCLRIDSKWKVSLSDTERLWLGE